MGRSGGLLEVPKSPWQDIDTAPRDELIVLAYLHHDPVQPECQWWECRVAIYDGNPNYDRWHNVLPIKWLPLPFSV